MYYVLIMNDKISGKGQCPCSGEGIQCIEVTEEVYNNLDHFIWNGEEIVENPNYEQEHYAALCEECRVNREEAYTAEVDPLTSHIQRLKDEEQTPEVIAKIQELTAERALRVAQIQERYPYPEEPTSNIS